MNLLVLDIKVPELHPPLETVQLPLKLLALWPNFLSYFISFLILGVYWVGHHFQFSFIRRVDRPLLWINILFLLWVALVPFSTALLSEYSKTRVAIAIYGLNLIAVGLTLALQWWYATTETCKLVRLSWGDFVCLRLPVRFWRMRWQNRQTRVRVPVTCVALHR